MKKTPLNIMINMIPDYFRDRIKIPTGQREGHIWTLEQKQSLIDSLYNDFDIPKIYFRNDPKKPDIWFLIDGQQRLEAIREFLDNRFPMAVDVSTIPPHVAGKLCRQLRPEDKAKIVNQSLTAILFETDDDSEEEDMFLRLNNGTPLNAAEKRNAIKGQFRDLVKTIAKHKLFKSKVSYSPKRYANEAVAAQLIAVYMAGGPANLKGAALKKIYNDLKVFPGKNQAKQGVTKTLNLIDRIFTDKEPFMKKFYAVSIFILLSDLIRNYAIANISTRSLKKFFLDFEKMRSENALKTEEDTGYKSDLYEFYEKSVNSPDSEDSVKTRHDILSKYFFSEFPDLSLKDQRRLFTNEQKLTIYYLSSGLCRGVKSFKCPNKSSKIPFSDGEFDHIVEHSQGGKTSVKNGQFLCEKCHQFKTHSH